MIDFEYELKKLEKHHCSKMHICPDCNVEANIIRNINYDYIDITHKCPVCGKEVTYKATKMSDGNYISRPINTSNFIIK